MEIIEAVKSRKSIRGFKAEPVTEEVLTGLLDAAHYAPSGFNGQSWEFVVLTGEVLEAVRKGNQDLFDQGMKPEYYMGTATPTGKYRERQVEMVQELYKLLGIPREDEAKRRSWNRRNVAFHNAPAAIIVCADKETSEFRSIFEAGLVAQNIALAALHFGLGTCLMMAPTYYPEVLRRVAKIPESKRVFIAIAVGYPDPDFPGNQLRRMRVPVSDLITWRSKVE
ncbi:MAG: nitroreductase [Chloroflexota bacterium]